MAGGHGDGIRMAVQSFSGYPTNTDPTASRGLPTPCNGVEFRKTQNVGAPRGRKMPAGGSPAREIDGSSR